MHARVHAYARCPCVHACAGRIRPIPRAGLRPSPQAAYSEVLQIIADNIFAHYLRQVAPLPPPSHPNPDLPNPTLALALTLTVTPTLPSPQPFSRCMRQIEAGGRERALAAPPAPVAAKGGCCYVM